jgi:hypothetical protein
MMRMLCTVAFWPVFRIAMYLGKSEYIVSSLTKPSNQIDRVIPQTWLVSNHDLSTSREIKNQPGAWYVQVHSRDANEYRDLIPNVYLLYYG